ncbi:ubiquitin carboxyl-terminal hydrolase of the cysteine proteinase fold [Cryptosporidium canis]|uniref:ubiquitinyl hydrolase 1 n=1 Tax=Cryptosporidium canis TaxID=195482 RepID=A0ABQ8P9P9_9CRYT|nr:ubiquitin carboxyl-terminal hydrolase of the cysteine proteinase fold [Cryptosporidium canis]
MTLLASPQVEKRQDSSPVTLQISNRVVSFVPGGFLAVQAEMQDSSNGPSDPKASGTAGDLLEEKEQVVSNAPLGRPEYYYFPPELITDARAPLEPRELARFRPYGRGLANPGWNTCYFNSILQALTYAPYLSTDCLRRNHQRICKHRHDQLVCMMCMFEDHVHVMLDNTSKSSGENQPVVSSFIKCAQKLIWRRFKIGMMHDAQEFLRYFLEALHKSCFPKSLQSDHVFRKIHPITASTTYIGQLFCGFFLSRIICSTCNYTSNTYDPFMDIPLDIMGVSNLENALQLFTKTEFLTGENRYICPKCKKRSDASKQLLIERLPPLLTIQLKRFSYVAHGSRKPNKAIRFPETLNLEPFLASRTHPVRKNTPSSASDSAHTYKLWAVVCHAGSTLSCGHYYTYARSINNKWYCFNDEYVKPSRLESVLDENYKAYLLFYYRPEFNREDLLSGSPASSKGSLGGDIQALSPLAPEVSLINVRLGADSRVGSRGAGSQHPEKLSGSEQSVDKFLDQLLERGSDKTSSIQSQDTSSAQNPVDSNDIRLVLTPESDSRVSDQGSERPSSSSQEGQEELGRDGVASCFRLRSLLLCNNWTSKSRTRRNLATILYLKKLKRLRLAASYFRGSSSPSVPVGPVSISRSPIQQWEDLNLSGDAAQSLEDAQKSLLARSNVRSDYDKEYDKGKVKKPLRQAKMISESTGEIVKNINKNKGTSKKPIYMGNGTNMKDLNSLSNSQLFDIAFNNRGNLKNVNKRRTTRLR